MKTIAVVDPASYTLPYDYFYLSEVSKYYKIDFYYSITKYNYEYIEKLKANKNINFIEYSISSSVVNRVIGIISYTKMLIQIYLKKSEYNKIHFMWNIFLPIEKVFFKLYGDKFVFTFHNNVPHSFKGKIFKPYKKINKLAQKKVFVSNFTKEKFMSDYENFGEYYLLSHGIMPISDENKKIDISMPSDDIYFWGRVEEYKGIDIFQNFLTNYKVKIYGKWSINLSKLKNVLNNKENIEVVDSYLSNDELVDLLCSDNIFILPYIDATQSGVLYTLLAYEKVFISSNVGENSIFLKENGLDSLIFNRKNEKSIIEAFEFAKNNYKDIKEKLSIIKNQYKWGNIMTESKIKDIYE